MPISIPSLSKNLSINAINFAKFITNIDGKIIKTILHTRKLLLFNKNEVWVKKENPDFDVTVGSFDVAEVCELVGLFLLDTLKKEFGDNKIGLYRDDGLSFFQNLAGPESEKIKQKLCNIFKKHGLNITVECNLCITDFLDVTFDLRTGKYYPYRKVKYIHKQLNHPPSITKQIPDMISERISNISCDKECFDKAASHYNNALKKSGFNENIKFTPRPLQRIKRSRNILWFDPPYSSNVKTNIGKIFFRFLDKHFPKYHKYYKLFNRNDVKISYSCMQNMASVIQNHNTNLLKDPVAPTAKECSCRQKSNCLLAEKCFSECLVYHAQVDRSNINQTKNYYDTCEKKFKGRYNNHTASFRTKIKKKVQNSQNICEN